MGHRILVDVIVRDAYSVRYEQVDEHTFGHVEVHHWNHRIQRQFLDDIDVAIRLLGRPVYALYLPGERLQIKFLTLCGFKPCGQVRDAEGRLVPIYGRPPHGRHLRWWHDHQPKLDQRIPLGA